MIIITHVVKKSSQSIKIIFCNFKNYTQLAEIIYIYSINRIDNLKKEKSWDALLKLRGCK
jgi:hypothetical protein